MGLERGKVKAKIRRFDAVLNGFLASYNQASASCGRGCREFFHAISLCERLLALLGTAPPSAPGADEAEDVTLLQYLTDDLAVELLAAGAVGIEPHAGLAAGTPAGEAPGTGVVAGLLEVGAEHAAFGQVLVVSDDAEAAAILAGAAGALDQLGPEHAEGRERLHYFGRGRRAVAAVGVDGVEAVAVGVAAHAAADDVGDDVVGLAAVVAARLRTVVETAGAEGGEADLASGGG